MPLVALKSKEGKWVITSCILASAMAFIDGTALNVVLPALQKSLNASGADLFWILNAYLLILASLILIGGAMGDQMGRKKVFMIGIVIFILGSLACGFSGNVEFLIAFRVIQGLGGALMIPGSLSLIAASIKEEERGKAIGTWSAFTTMVTMGGPILGGALADAGLWRSIFFMNVPLGIAALLMLWFKVDESRNLSTGKHLDYIGSMVIALGLALLTFGFLRTPALGWQNWQVLGSIGIGLVLFIVFIQIERRSSNPMTPPRLFANSTFIGANLLTLFLYGGMTSGMLFLSLDLVQVQGFSQLQSGLTFLPFTVIMLSVSRIAGAWADRFGPKVFLIIGPACAGIGLFIVSMIRQTAGPSEYWTTFFPGVLVFGLGMSFTVVPLTAAVMGAAGERFSGAASGVNNALSRVANVFANAIFGALAVLIFSASLQNRVKKISLNSPQRLQIMAQAGNLGNAGVPADIGYDKREQIIKAYHESFIEVYSVILKLSAGLCFFGSLMALLTIKNHVTIKHKSELSLD